ncbi:sulfatase [Opitutia bacterium ISCC 51]|nr:sulfatase [Opitutae bacterium ISCC 51]QXD30192.1 sulfatase [Opitutae bacterium ISCC 52]
MNTARIAFLIFTFSFPFLAYGTEQAPKNVLMISVDDMRDWTNFLGGYEGEVFTPHMDRLAERGINFTNAHCPSPVCNPSRNAVMTGLMPSTTGIYNNGQWLRANYPDKATLPRYFMNQGYQVVGTGKSFHHTAGNNPPDQWHAYHRFSWVDFPWTRSNKLAYPWTKWMPPPEGYPFSKVEYLRGKEERDWGILPKKEEDYDDVVVVDYAVDFLNQYEGEKPFFLSVGTFHPHLPWYIPKRFNDLYAGSEIHLPEAPENDLDDLPPIPQNWAERRRDEMDAAKEAGEWEEAVRCYLASISFADAQIGRVIGALAESPHADNTIIILWSDHGWHLGEKNHWHKSTLWEEATRVPFIIATPGMKQAGQSSSRPVNLVSIYPTLVGLLDLESDIDFDGPDLAPLLDNPNAAWPHASLIDFGYGNTAVRDEHWRYIRYNDGTEELYDHQTDPNEWKNLAADQAYQSIKGELAKHLPTFYAEDVPSKDGFIFDPDNWTFTNKKTGRVIHGNKK